MTNTEKDAATGQLVRERKELREAVELCRADLARMGSQLWAIGQALDAFRSAAPQEHRRIRLNEHTFQITHGTRDSAATYPELSTIADRLGELESLLVRLNDVEAQVRRLNLD